MDEKHELANREITPVVALAPADGVVFTVQGASHTLTLCQCSRCGNLWAPRQEIPILCPECRSSLWNKPRVYRIEGAPSPTQHAKPRGRAFPKGHRNPKGSANSKTNNASP
jgi:DNA-directed RNA polymerase subunit RPC12/RpoP